MTKESLASASQLKADSTRLETRDHQMAKRRILDGDGHVFEIEREILVHGAPV
jgi:hypothetical protein